METKEKIPAIRFKGFEGEWEKDILGQITEVYDGTHQTPRYTNNGIMFLSVENIKTLKSSKYISESDFKKDFNVFPEDGDVLMTRIGDIGTANVVKTDAPIAYYVSLALFKKSKINTQFLKESIGSESVRKDLWHRTLHIAFPKKINKNEIEKVEIKYPKSKSEQTKIGNYFKELDSLIRLQEQKLEKISNLKKAMLEKMFPKENADVPEIRFEGFTEKWEDQKLSNIGEITGGGTPSTTNKEFWNGTIDWYSPTEIGNKVYANGSEKKITQLGLEKSSATILPADRTVLFTSRAGIGDMAILKRPGATNQGFQSLVLKDDYDTYFIFSMGFLIKKFALKYSSGSTFLEISGKALGKMQIKIPELEEQQKIGKYFQNLDQLIDQTQQKIEQLKHLKQALLQKMFI